MVPLRRVAVWRGFMDFQVEGHRHISHWLNHNDARRHLDHVSNILIGVVSRRERIGSLVPQIELMVVGKDLKLVTNHCRMLLLTIRRCRITPKWNAGGSVPGSRGGGRCRWRGRCRRAR